MLELLLFCHKYVCHELQDHVTPLLKPLTEINTLRTYLASADCRGLTTSRILEVANAVGNEAITRSARGLIIEETWKSQTDRNHPLLHDDIHKVLAFGELHIDQEIIGCAYYQILCSKPLEAPWDTSQLSEQQIVNLERLQRMLLKEWEDIFAEVAAQERYVIITHNHRGVQQTTMHSLMVRLGEARLLPYDVIGRVQLLEAVWKEIGAGHQRPSAVLERARLRVQGKIHALFLPDRTTENGA